MPTDRPAYPSDVSDEEWALVAPYLELLREDSAQRDHDCVSACNFDPLMRGIGVQF